MKFNRLFIIGVLAFIALVFVVQYRMPRKFQWTPTYDHRDRQPFGCYVFDSTVKNSLPQDYRVVKKTFYQLSQDSTAAPQGVLMVADEVRFTTTDIAVIRRLAARGWRILLASEMLGALADSLQLASEWHYTPGTLLQYAQKGQERDTIVWQGDSTYCPRCFTYYPQLLSHTIGGKVDSLGYRVLSRSCQHSEEPVAVRITIGQGAVIWVSTPLVFTNYGILDQDNYHYVFRLLTQLDGLPVVRTESYIPKTAATQTPLRYILSQQPLRWALYLTLLTITLFMVFTARRRQRAVPVVKEPENMSLAFARQIGTLYAQRKDYTDAVVKKYTYMAEELRTLLHIDITDVTADAHNLRLLALHTGQQEPQLAVLLDELRRLAADHRRLTAADMTRYIRDMNEIIKGIKF